MSVAVDTDVLVYASHRGSAFHQAAVELLQRLAAGPELVYLFWLVIMGYLRITTHPSLLEAPLSPSDAMTNIGRLLAPPHVRAAGEPERFWASYRRVADPVAPRGNLVPDAHLVALMRHHGVPAVWSHDRDLRKFDGIAVRDPFEGVGPAAQ